MVALRVAWGRLLSGLEGVRNPLDAGFKSQSAHSMNIKRSRRIHFLLTGIGGGIAPKDLLPYTEEIFLDFGRGYTISVLRYLFKKKVIFYDPHSRLFLSSNLESSPSTLIGAGMYTKGGENMENMEEIRPGDIVDVFAGKEHIGLGIVIEVHEKKGGRGYRYKLVLNSDRIKVKKVNWESGGGGGCLDGTELL